MIVSEDDDEFPEFSLSELTGNEIQIDMDLSQEPKCQASLMISTDAANIYVHCCFPDLEWVHATYNGHLAKDGNGGSWTWNDEGVSLVESQ